MPDRFVYRFNLTPPGRRKFSKKQHAQVVRWAIAAMLKDSVQHAKRNAPVRTGALRRSIKRTRDPRVIGSDLAGQIWIDPTEYNQRQNRPSTNASVRDGRRSLYWRFLLGTGPRYHARGNILGPPNWPPRGWYTGAIPRGKYSRWLERIDDPSIELMSRWYGENLGRLSRGEKLKSPR